MRLNGNRGLAIFLIGCGALILLDKAGFGLGSLLGYIIPAVIMILGYIGIKNGSKFFGGVFFILGLIILLGMFSGIIGFIIAAGMIFYGVSLLRKRSGAH